ncbi:hypothetical protein [Lysinibacillus sphaericus]|uniref:Lipoprotein n=1 Tax=Lysinibacillus sphaericus OT4b.31 TaxID=1285586 RepID=R7ZIY3_LYSSH|nr:hypothetical protein [Lysinibacillus sphaericus]EON74055.1 hypothetical protein H131_05309 [Lysinibacillus sphaericus OT4b.31]
MLNKWSLFLLICLLSACSSNEAAPTKKEEATEKQPAQTTLPQSLEEWQSIVNKSEWYKQMKDEFPVTAEQFVDFDGDQIPEYILGHSSQTQYGYVVGKYNTSDEIWEYWSELQYEYPIYNEVAFHGILKGQNGKEILIASDFQPGAKTISHEMNLIKASDDNSRVILGFKEYVEQREDITINPTTNSFHLAGTELNQTYILKNDHLLVNNEKIVLETGLPIIHNEAFMQALNNSFTKTGISFMDTLGEGREKDKTIAKEEFFEGVFCNTYEDYSICTEFYNQNLDEVPITHVLLFNFKQVSAKDISKAIKQEIKIETHDYTDTIDKILYNTSFTVDNVLFHANFDGPTEEALLQKLSIQNPKAAAEY